jgi:hypothetical protein
MKISGWPVPASMEETEECHGNIKITCACGCRLRPMDIFKCVCY